jgi:predicted metal-dependent hydrolase
VRAMKTRWGSCSASGRLLLNSQLIELPSSAIDYVIAHELCHLRVAKHGARFDRLLARLMPDWRDRQETLSRAMGT